MHCWRIELAVRLSGLVEGRRGSSGMRDMIRGAYVTVEGIWIVILEIFLIFFWSTQRVYFDSDFRHNFRSDEKN